MVRTQPSQGWYTGSTPVRAANTFIGKLRFPGGFIACTPVILCGIGGLPGTLHDKSILVRLESVVDRLLASLAADRTKASVYWAAAFPKTRYQHGANSIRT